MVDVLPDPFGPSSPKMLPAGTVRSSMLTVTLSANRFTSPRHSTGDGMVVCIIVWPRHYYAARLHLFDDRISERGSGVVLDHAKGRASRLVPCTLGVMSAREGPIVRCMWAQGRWAGLLAAAVLSTGCYYWARSSAQPVPRLTHPSFHRVTQAVQPPFLFAIFGDQKGLAKTGGWDALLRQASALEPPPPLFLLDTGDIVENGTYSDQFVQLKEILSVVDGLPYLLAVGNHEIDDDDTAAKGHVVGFLGDVIGRDQFSEERLFYAKTVGPLRLLVLESNDLVYPARGACRDQYSTGARGAEQLSWLTEELSHAWDGPAVVAFHHTMILSASKHEGHARCLLNGSYAAHGERTLPEILIDRGVDVVLTGHTHIRSPLPYSEGARDAQRQCVGYLRRQSSGAEGV